MTDPTIEGRLIALRQALALVIAGTPRQDILRALAMPPGDGQEDPGAVEADAIEGAIAEEKRLLAREVRLRG